MILTRAEGPVEINGFRHFKRATMSTRTRGSLRRSSVPVSSSGPVTERVFILASMSLMDGVSKVRKYHSD